MKSCTMKKLKSYYDLWLWVSVLDNISIWNCLLYILTSLMIEQPHENIEIIEEQYKRLLNQYNSDKE